MSKRNSVLALSALTVLAVVSMALARVPKEDIRFAQVRAEYIALSGNNDVTTTTVTLVNRSASTTLYLGDLSALGLDGLAEVLAIDTGLDGVGIPPLGSLDLPVDAAHFPGLQAKDLPDSRGVETILVSYSGPKESLRLTAAIKLQLPGDVDSRTVSRVDGHAVTR
jgi:hypothetical protein